MIAPIAAIRLLVTWAVVDVAKPNLSYANANVNPQTKYVGSEINSVTMSVEAKLIWITANISALTTYANHFLYFAHKENRPTRYVSSSQIGPTIATIVIANNGY